MMTKKIIKYLLKIEMLGKKPVKFKSNEGEAANMHASVEVDNFGKICSTICTNNQRK